MEFSENGRSPAPDCWDTVRGRAYTLLFNAMTDAAEAMDTLNFGDARAILRRAQSLAEDLLVECSDPLEPGAPAPEQTSRPAEEDDPLYSVHHRLKTYFP